MNVSRLNDFLRVNVCYKHCLKGCANQRLADFPNTFPLKEAEQVWYDVWEKNHYFPVQDHNKEPLRMILPPPNVTGILHLGHALTVTVQDILARWYRMKGHPVIWVPGLDHAGIATQATVEKYLFKTKGKTRAEMGKDEFLQYIWEWKNEKGDIIRKQLKSMGATLDWSKEYFTLSKEHSEAVTEAFVQLNERDLLYREKSLVNWCPSLCSTVSEIEVNQVYLTQKTLLDIPGYEKKVAFGQMVEIVYPVKDSKNEIVIATTRPESVFGDVAIAVHPDDERYANYIGQQVWHPFRKTYIPIIADSLVNKEFGTGAVKITPAHDRVDYEIARKHQLEVIDVFDERGNITDAGGEYKSLPRFVAREKVLNECANQGILKSVKDHRMCVPICSRSNNVIEYLLKEQWYIKSKDMADRTIESVKDGSLKLVPPSHEESWYQWLQSIRDWCVSRQLWWGHHIPAYNITVGDFNEWIVARSEEEARLIAEKKYGSDVRLRQDDDVLDTWFSSAILPFAAMGWPHKDFEKHYPLTLMETGHDILFFWVARMAMLGLELTGRLPFKEVLLHGILCDANGKKMSKSVGNVITPENIINGISLADLNASLQESHNAGIFPKSDLNRMMTLNKKMLPNGIIQCGADALRMTLCNQNIQNDSIGFDVLICQSHKFFTNKVWQASKYVLLMANDDIPENPESLATVDHWILSRLSLMIEDVNSAFAERRFHKAITSIKEFLHHEFCDFYLEATKWGMKSNNKDVIASHLSTLTKCLEISLRVLSPIAPYLTDELYKRLSKKLPGFLSVTSLLEAPYPVPGVYQSWRNEDLDERMNGLLDVIVQIRRLSNSVSKKTNPEVHIVTSNPDDYRFYNDNMSLIQGGSKMSNSLVFLETDYNANENSVHCTITPECSVLIVSEDESVLAQVKTNMQRKVEKSESKVAKRRTIKEYA